METREQIVARLMVEDEKLQYDEKDQKRIYDASEKVTKAFVSLLNLLAEFRHETMTEVDEDSAVRMAQIRMDLVEAYADALVNLHKLGVTFRISGEAFDRMVKHLEGDGEAPLVMAGL